MRYFAILGLYLLFTQTSNAGLFCDEKIECNIRIPEFKIVPADNSLHELKIFLTSEQTLNNSFVGAEYLKYHKEENYRAAGLAYFDRLGLYNEQRLLSFVKSKFMDQALNEPISCKVISPDKEVKAFLIEDNIVLNNKERFLRFGIGFEATCLVKKFRQEKYTKDEISKYQCLQATRCAELIVNESQFKAYKKFKDLMCANEAVNSINTNNLSIDSSNREVIQKSGSSSSKLINSQEASPQ